jgi:metal transporter CNNM
MNILTWLGISFCISQSAIFSGLNLAVFSVSKLRLEVAASAGNRDASKVIALRKNSNFLLTTILWGNVGINVLLTLLSNSVLTGLAAFFFSTVVISFFGEIIPQAYFSRKALRMAALFSPVLKFYQVLLYPVAKPTAIVLDWWLGPEAIHYFREKDLRELITKHIKSKDADVDYLEGVGAINFLAIDDLAVICEGEPVDPRSIISLPIVGKKPVFPRINRSPADPFLRQVHSSGKKWVIITDETGRPRLALDSDAFLRSALFGSGSLDPLVCCHLPIIVSDRTVTMGQVISQLKIQPLHSEDDVIDNDIILIWSDEKRVITGADILGRLLRGIVSENNPNVL